MTNIDPPSWHEGAYWPPKATRDAKERAVRHAAGMEGQDATREPHDATEAAQEPFSRVFREGGSPAPGHVGQAERALDEAFPPGGEVEVIPDATEAAQGRVERYAEAIWNVDPDVPYRTFPTGSRYAEVHADVRDIVNAALRVADQEQAELRAEVERQAVLLRAINDCHLDPARAILQADRLAGEAIIRAHIAESRVAELEATVARVRAAYEAAKGTVAGRMGLADELRAILDAGGVL